MVKRQKCRRRVVKKSLYPPLLRYATYGPYRTPTQVGRGKYPKVDERSSVKELGKLAP